MYTIYDINWQVLSLDYKDLLRSQDLQMIYDVELSKYYAFVEERVMLDEEQRIARRKARQNVLIKQYEELYRLKDLGNPTNLIKDIQLARENIGEKTEKTINNYVWLCVNPNSTYVLSDFVMLVEKAFTKKWIESYVYVYEQRGIVEEEVGKGFHLHALIKKPHDMGHKRMLKELSNTFKKCCDTSNFHYFQLKMIDDAEYMRKLEYILGNKESDQHNQKEIKQMYDKPFRQKNKLQNFYYKNLEIPEKYFLI